MYWRRRFFTLWTQVETVASESPDANVLYVGLDVIRVLDRLFVALERVLFFLDGWRGIEVLYRNPALDRDYRVP
jgi:hypothetical protein